jgi:hypothetical protein
MEHYLLTRHAQTTVGTARAPRCVMMSPPQAGRVEMDQTGAPMVGPGDLSPPRLALPTLCRFYVDLVSILTMRGTWHIVL